MLNDLKRSKITLSLDTDCVKSIVRLERNAVAFVPCLPGQCAYLFPINSLPFNHLTDPCALK
jgi:hypothetical protein